MRQRLTERFQFSGGQVDRGGTEPVIRGVLLCGPTSANRRRYRKEAFAGDRVKRYEGRPVYLNHGGREGRTYQELIGTIRNARHRADGMPVGDIAVRPKHPFAEQLLHDAQHNPAVCGMSHVAQCDTARGADGWEDVTELLQAESVDIVLDPATTHSLYENANRRGTTMKVTVLCERVRGFAKARPAAVRAAEVLREEAGDDAEIPGEEVGDLNTPDDADQAVTAGLLAAATAVLKKVFAGAVEWAAAKRTIDKIVMAGSWVGAAADDDTAESIGRRVGVPLRGRHLAEHAPAGGDGGLKGFLSRISG